MPKKKRKLSKQSLRRLENLIATARRDGYRQGTIEVSVEDVRAGEAELQNARDSLVRWLHFLESQDTIPSARKVDKWLASLPEEFQEEYHELADRVTIFQLGLSAAVEEGEATEEQYDNGYKLIHYLIHECD